MRNSTRVMAFLICVPWLSAAGPHGTVPRATNWRYPAHGELDGVKVGAALLTTQQARQIFATGINRCCLVVEVAIYPEKDKPLDVSLDDFAFRTVGSNSATKAESAEVVAATLNQNAQPSGRPVTVSESVGVGVESGPRYDPSTGNTQGRQTGVYTSAGVGVGIGTDPSIARPGSTDRDRQDMEAELNEKGLPEGAAVAPVAGYLYIPVSSSKKKSHGHQLEYTLNGIKLTLQLP
ncbi:MAG TPA: hypothetical protein VKV95_07805 [Terriglobia bacterium]|nr:hypothetical protein [Terriglobia bacterium]